MAPRPPSRDALVKGFVARQAAINDRQGTRRTVGPRRRVPKPGSGRVPGFTGAPGQAKRFAGPAKRTY